jgi:hypothetical protein
MCVKLVGYEGATSTSPVEECIETGIIAASLLSNPFNPGVGGAEEFV